MTAFTLSKSVWEFAKSRVIFAMRVSVVYVPTCKSRANVLFLRANVPINVQTCKRCANYSTLSAKRHTNFSTIFQKNFSIFEFFNYAQYLEISKIFGQFYKTYLTKQRSQILIFAKFH